MSALKAEPREAPARTVSVFEDTLTVDLHHGRMVSVPAAWYPRLSHGSLPESDIWCLIGDGLGIHCPDLGEDISVEGAWRRRVEDRYRSSYASIADSC